ncbi:MAG TPA: hypothetical protein VER36_10870 [Flavisolibacter sp.]|nr:hypothetical protein [Flavisolibacter sp.]
MRLNLALNGILVASAKLDPSRCNDEYYLQAMRRLLLQQNGEVLALIPAKPVYYIEVPSSSATSLFTENEWTAMLHKQESLGLNLAAYKPYDNVQPGSLFSSN